MFVILGLGNPGGNYEFNRHNIGYLLIDKFCDRFSVRLKYDLKYSIWGKVDNTELILAKPKTYMNCSGLSAKELLDNFCNKLESLFVLVDDVNLPFGDIRLRKRGSAGGHNGLKSIIQSISTDEFPRLRLGVGPYDDRIPLRDFVLEDFSPKEKKSLTQILDKSVVAVQSAIEDGFDIAMSKYNGSVLEEPEV